MKTILGIGLVASLLLTACGGEDPAAEALAKIQNVVDQANGAMEVFVAEAEKATTDREFAAALDKFSLVWGAAGKHLKRLTVESALFADSSADFDKIVNGLDPWLAKREKAIEAGIAKFGESKIFEESAGRFMQANESWE